MELASMSFSFRFKVVSPIIITPPGGGLKKTSALNLLWAGSIGEFVQKQQFAPPDPIDKLKIRAAKLASLVFFLVLLLDSTVTHIVPILKHIWHTIHSP